MSEFTDIPTPELAELAYTFELSITGSEEQARQARRDVHRAAGNADLDTQGGDDR